jgi:hypothetical protein
MMCRKPPSSSIFKHPGVAVRMFPALAAGRLSPCDRKLGLVPPSGSRKTLACDGCFKPHRAP